MIRGLHEMVFLIFKLFGFFPMTKWNLYYASGICITFTVVNVYLKVDHFKRDTKAWYLSLYLMRGLWENLIVWINVIEMHYKSKKLERTIKDVFAQRHYFPALVVVIVIMKEIFYFIFVDLVFYKTIQERIRHGVVFTGDIILSLAIAQYLIICTSLSKSMADIVLKKENAIVSCQLFMKTLEDQLTVNDVFQKQNLIISVRLGCTFTYYLNHFRKELTICEETGCDPVDVCSVYDRLFAAFWQIALLVIFIFPTEVNKKIVSTNIPT